MTEEVQSVEVKWICGFWRRIGALLFDTIFIGLFGFLLGLILESWFVQIGPWGRLLGFIISMSYFGLMNSRLFDGQTLGKKVLKIKVVDASNASISVGKSFLRYSFIAIPFSLNGAQISENALGTFMIYPLSIIIFGGLLSLNYLYIFNRNTRQSIHDLATGTYVVNSHVEKHPVEPVFKAHYAVVALIVISAAIIPVFTSTLAESEPFKGLLKTQQILSKAPLVQHVSISDGEKMVMLGDAEKTATYVNAHVQLYKDTVLNNDFARQLAEKILSSYPQAQQKNLIQITLSYGYDIGITSKWNTQDHQFIVAELLAQQAI